MAQNLTPETIKEALSHLVSFQSAGSITGKQYMSQLQNIKAKLEELIAKDPQAAGLQELVHIFNHYTPLQVSTPTPAVGAAPAPTAPAPTVATACKTCKVKGE